MQKYLEDAAREIKAHREEIINKMVQLSLTDMLLFWGQKKDLMERQQQVWGPLLQWAQDSFKTHFAKTFGLEVPSENEASGARLKLFMESLNDRELAAFYVAALNMRSVLLAAALVKGRINAEEAYQAAYLEELWQAENWGSDEEAESKRQERLCELREVEKFLKTAHD